MATSTTAMRSERSQSRGREFTSTGRGGAGNMVRSDSVSRSRDPSGLLADAPRASTERGRELPPANGSGSTTNTNTTPTHVGRGGAGNVRSPSRNPDPVNAVREEILAEQSLIDASKDPNATVTYSTGRGGAGNIRRSPNASVSPGRARAANERSRSREPVSGRRFQSTGRGGAGNLKPVEAELSKVDENSTSDDSDRGRSDEKHPHGIGSLLDKITGHHH